MNIIEKLEMLETESKQQYLDKVIRDIQLFDYYQLNLIQHSITKRMSNLRQEQEDMKEEENYQQQIEQQKIQTTADQIENTKKRTKRPRVTNERVGEIILRNEK